MRLIAQLLILILFYTGNCYAAVEPGVQAETTVQLQQKEEPREAKASLFRGTVNTDGINVRTDSTTSAEVICKVNKNEVFDVISESYDWYKIRLPRSAPAFIKKDFIDFGETTKTAKISADNVNIRLRPDLSSPILGKAGLGEEVRVLQEEGEWCKIEPIKNNFGWINKNFVKKVEEKKVKPAAGEPGGEIVVVGLIKPKSVINKATHKITSLEGKMYLLRSDTEDLDKYNRKRVRIFGIIKDPAPNNPIIDIEKLEVLD